MSAAFASGTRCWYLASPDERASGVVAGKVSWGGRTLALIEVDEDEFVVRSADLITDREDGPIGFSQVDDALYAGIADLVLANRVSAG